MPYIEVRSLDVLKNLIPTIASAPNPSIWIVNLFLALFNSVLT